MYPDVHMICRSIWNSGICLNSHKLIEGCTLDPIYTGLVTTVQVLHLLESKKISNDQELIQSDPISCPQNQKGEITKYIN